MIEVFSLFTVSPYISVQSLSVCNYSLCPQTLLQFKNLCDKSKHSEVNSYLSL